MLERHIEALVTDDPGAETPSEGRSRLKGHFPAGATRRMTTLGLMVGSALSELDPGQDDAIVYASAFAESGALEGFLESFPTPSPTLFQTSIHPSAVQQLMIGRQTAVREFLPLSGGPLFAFQALRAAFTLSAPRVILCGGEERGTWLLEHGLASGRAFAFAASLRREEGPGAVGRVRLGRADGSGGLGLAAWFDLLHGRVPFAGMVAPGWRMELQWR
jgi:hypothetical protein